MRRFIVMLFGLWLVATSAAAQDANAIEDVIGDQLRAFNDRDVAEAWQYASPNIKRLFGSSDNFGMMVQQGYPMVWDNRDVRYLELREISGNIWQKVRVVDPSGTEHWLNYQMIETVAGWRINGVQLLPPEDIGT